AIEGRGKRHHWSRDLYPVLTRCVNAGHEMEGEAPAPAAPPALGRVPAFVNMMSPVAHPAFLLLVTSLR
ncbi:MAG TPA: hypothetical protein VN415_10110, partial [Dehalococcoidia bacterium]|nr:hypothetical protein [Dehalococcoidia bacterium]